MMIKVCDQKQINYLGQEYKHHLFSVKEPQKEQEVGIESKEKVREALVAMSEPNLTENPNKEVKEQKQEDPQNESISKEEDQQQLEQVKLNNESKEEENPANHEDSQEQQYSKSQNQFQVTGNSQLEQQDSKNATIYQYYSIRKERQQADQDAQSLANRISLLKQEEMRTLKKIEETRKKAMEIYYLKLKNQDKAQKKQTVQEEEMKKKKTRVANLRAFSQESKVEVKKQYESDKQKNVQKIKEMKQNNEKKIELSKQRQIYQAREKNENVKKQRESRQAKIEEFKNWKKEVIKKEIEDKTSQENRIKAQKLKEMKNMENLEIDIISRLQSTQQMQKHAYEELESALLLNTEDFYSKYLKKEQANDSQKSDGENGMQKSNSQPTLQQEQNKEQNQELNEDNQEEQEVEQQ